MFICLYYNSFNLTLDAINFTETTGPVQTEAASPLIIECI